MQLFELHLEAVWVHAGHDVYPGVVEQPPELVLQKFPSEANPMVRNHGEGPY